MANAVKTLTRPSYARGFADGNLRVHYRDLTLDTGNYVQATGIPILASDVGFRVINFISTSGGVATSGTTSATGNGVGFTYAADGTSATMWLYESAATGLAFLEKTDAEAIPANFTIRLRIEGR